MKIRKVENRLFVIYFSVIGIRNALELLFIIASYSGDGFQLIHNAAVSMAKDGQGLSFYALLIMQYSSLLHDY